MTLSPFVLAFLVSSMVLKNASYLAISTFAKNQSNADTLVLYHMERYLIDLPAKHNPLSDFGLAYESVEIPSNDEPGLMLRGWFVPNTKTRDVILCAHGAYVDKLDMLKHTKYLYDEGYSVLLLDVRDHGASDSKDHRGTSLGIREHRDLIAAIDYLVANKFEDVIMLGSSTGASSSIMAAIEHPKVKAVIAENPFASRVEQVAEGIHSALFKGSWGENRMEDHSPALAAVITIIKDYTPAHLWIELTARVAAWRMSNYRTFFFWDPIDRIHELKRPLLLIHSERDTQVFPHHSLRLYEKSDKSLTELWMLPEGKHSMLYQHNPQQYQERVLAFLRKL